LKSNKSTIAFPLTSSFVLGDGVAEKLVDSSGFQQLLQYATPWRIEKPFFEISSAVQVQNVVMN
jgi:hypothetical protein